MLGKLIEICHDNSITSPKLEAALKGGHYL